MEEKRSEIRAEALGPGCHVLVTAEHRFTTDTLLLADFSMPRPGERCADLGTGCGTIPLLWSARGKPEKVLAVELQEDAVALAARSVEENGLSEEIAVLCGDVRAYRTCLPHQGLDLVACNPPYFPVGRGAAGEGSRKTARHEGTLTLSDLAAAAKYGLKWGGRLCLCLPAERLPEAMALFCGAGLEPKRLRLVQSQPEKAPYLFLLECRYGGRSGLAVEPTLLLRDAAGEFTAELVRIYGDYVQNRDQ